jgi:hypothetical protein
MMMSVGWAAGLAVSIAASLYVPPPHPQAPYETGAIVLAGGMGNGPGTHGKNRGLGNGGGQTNGQQKGKKHKQHRNGRGGRGGSAGWFQGHHPHQHGPHGPSHRSLLHDDAAIG